MESIDMKHFFAFNILLLTTWVISATIASAQTLQDNLWVANAPVNSVVETVEKGRIFILIQGILLGVL
jgi:hypothetical protein